MMESFKTITLLFIIIFNIIGFHCDDPPMPTQVDTYRVVGEIIQLIGKSTKVLDQVFFEENYDHNNHRSSLNVTLPGKFDYRFLEYHILKQTFSYSGLRCQAIDSAQESLIPLKLNNFQVQDDMVVFPVHQLLDLQHSTMNFDKKTFDNTAIVYRGIPAQKWSYQFNEGNDYKVEIDAFWSIKSDYQSPSKNKEVPLGFNVFRTNLKTNEMVEQKINLFLFTHDEVNLEMLEPTRGIYCKGRADPELFPNLDNLKTLSYKSEIIMDDTITIMDAFLDPNNNLYVADFTPTSLLNTRSAPVRRVVSKQKGVSYTMSSRGSTVGSLSSLEDEPQSLVDLSDPLDWNITSWFGTNEIEYSAVGEKSDLGIPCILYHGLRRDWPKKFMGKVETLWEWCISNQAAPEVLFQEIRFPLLSLNIYVTESPFNQSTGFYYKGLHLAHHFHRVKSLEPMAMDPNIFDISSCFETDNKQKLGFSIQVNTADMPSLQKSTNVIHQWKQAIFESAKLDTSSLRISDVKVKISSSVVVSFTLLGIHPNVPKGNEVVNLQEAKSNINSAINSKTLQIDWPKIQSRESIKLFASPGSLRNIDVLPTNQEPGNTKKGFKPGDMAAVGIVMLLLGISLGAIGFFLKKRFLG